MKVQKEPGDEEDGLAVGVHLRLNKAHIISGVAPWREDAPEPKRPAEPSAHPPTSTPLVHPFTTSPSNIFPTLGRNVRSRSEFDNRVVSLP